METDKTVLDAQEAAEILGVHAETIRRLARKRELPSFKIGKNWRFRKDALLQWMEDASRKSQHPYILVIDDERSIRNLIRRYLEAEGYTVITASNGEEGLDLAGQHNIQLVLLDLKMPGMNGPEIIADLMVKFPNLPVIIVTGYPDSQMMMEINKQHPVMLVSKPISKSILLQAVHTTLEGSIAHRESAVY